jgi:hypothetical protein
LVSVLSTTASLDDCAIDPPGQACREKGRRGPFVLATAPDACDGGVGHPD